ncbi:hypothetical protein MJG53_016737 [Ovis ammon polii x Ovis aries]|uniref:Uncharacterized protein n=1 Tax=Ovis ammon polii x Ovis aries TaxID=2918886 RepID=A0ACB9U9M5_9CETA|nr:hypothetical protein MJG53_016737 [Ovis ammon polii x Ovis aries]
MLQISFPANLSKNLRGKAQLAVKPPAKKTSNTDLEADLHKVDLYAPSPKGSLCFLAGGSELFKYFPQKRRLMRTMAINQGVPSLNEITRVKFLAQHRMHARISEHGLYRMSAHNDLICLSCQLKKQSQNLESLRCTALRAYTAVLMIKDVLPGKMRDKPMDGAPQGDVSGSLGSRGHLVKLPSVRNVVAADIKTDLQASATSGERVPGMRSACTAGLFTYEKCCCSGLEHNRALPFPSLPLRGVLPEMSVDNIELPDPFSTHPISNLSSSGLPAPSPLPCRVDSVQHQTPYASTPPSGFEYLALLQQDARRTWEAWPYLGAVISTRPHAGLQVKVKTDESLRLKRLMFSLQIQMPSWVIISRYTLGTRSPLQRPDIDCPYGPEI